MRAEKLKFYNKIKRKKLKNKFLNLLKKINFIKN